VEFLVISELHDHTNIGDQRTVIVIGGGASGILIALNLLKQAILPARIIIVEPRAELGAGIPYSTTYNSHLLNVRVSGMSAFDKDPQHFLRWLRESRGESVDPDSFVPRMFYGHYLRASLSEAHQEVLGIPLEHYRTRANRIEIVDSRARVSLADNERLTGDRVVLAIGHQPPGNPMPEGSTGSAFSAWTEAAYVGLDPASPVLLVGSGLTAVDAVLALDQSGHRGPIHVLSRHGKWPLEHETTKPAISIGALEGDLTIRGLLKSLRVLRSEEVGGGWRAVVDGLRPQTASIWTRLSLSERRRFLRHVRYLWEIHRHKMPRQVAAKLAAMQTSGRLTIYAGRLVEATRTSPSSVRVGLKLRGDGDMKGFDVSRIINCTGGEGDPAKSNDPLVRNLLTDGLAQADPLRLGLMTDETGALISTGGAVSKMIFTLGPLRRGTLWESTSIPEIRVQAAALAEVLLREPHPPHDSEDNQPRLK
jgi:uncharacterized NAD(P)/FAD-binding protein YdhS